MGRRGGLAQAQARGAPSGRGPGALGASAAEAAQELLALIAGESEVLEEAEGKVLGILARAHAAGVLEPALALALSQPGLSRILPEMSPERRREYARRASQLIGAELSGAGYLPGMKGFEPWEEMSRRHVSLVRPRGRERPRVSSRVGDRAFEREMEALTGAPWSAGSEAKLLKDGISSFAYRDRLMRGARRSIRLMTWAIYDDETGERTAELLIAKRRAGVSVQVIVDGETSGQAGHGGGVLERLASAGIEVVRFRDPARPFDGLHAKLLVVDDRAAIAGGMNVGDPYSHASPRGPKWRDTDMAFSGPAAEDSRLHFARIWNEQVWAQNLPYAALSEAPQPQEPGASAGMRLAVVYQRPGEEARAHLGLLKAIAGASRRINIEAAYFISTPALRQLLLEALARGVEVSLLTNSCESIDEPVMCVPILESLPELVAAGARVYLKRGQTLHSKFMTVDGFFASVGSYNLHPRSIRYEHELVVNALDAGLASDLDRAFAEDLAQARQVRDPDELAIPKSPLHSALRRYFFNQL